MVRRGIVWRFYNYWFREGGYYSIAVARIALFSALYYTLLRITSTVGITSVDAWLEAASLSAYSPKGLVQLFAEAPPIWLVKWVVVLGHISTLAAIIGLVTRPAMIASVLSVLFLVSLDTSFRYYWSHAYNVLFYAGLAFMFGRAGDVLSLDALIRRWRRPDAAPLTQIHNGAYWWPVLLGQAAVALFFFGAFYAKVAGPDNSFTLDWVFSDNLRHSLAMPWIYRSRELPWYAQVIQGHPLLWQLAAAGHLLAQFLPILACFSTRSPKLRLFEGFVFVAGVFLLASFTGYWNRHWLPLLVLFVDWDYFLSRSPRLIRGLRRITLFGMEPNPGGTSRLGTVTLGTTYSALDFCVLTFVIAFLSFYVATFTLKLGKVHLLYPFSQLDFFSDVKALRPYHRHLHYPFYFGEISVLDGDKEVFIYVPRQITRLWPSFPTGYRHPSGFQKQTGWERAGLRGRMATLNAAAGQRQLKSFSRVGRKSKVRPENFRALRVYSTLFHLPAHPHSPKEVPVHRGLLGEVDGKTGEIRTAYGRILDDCKTGDRFLTVDVIGFTEPELQILYRLDPVHRAGVQSLRPLAANLLKDQWQVLAAAPGGAGLVPGRGLVVRLAGEALTSNPHYIISADGTVLGEGEVTWSRDTETVGRYDVSDQPIVWHNLLFQAEFRPPGPHRVTVAFPNDAWGGEEHPLWDRNLLVHSLHVDGQMISVEEAVFLADYGNDCLGRQRMSSGGHLEFVLPHDIFGPENPATNPIVLRNRYRLETEDWDVPAFLVLRIAEKGSNQWYDFLGPVLD